MSNKNTITQSGSHDSNSYDFSDDITFRSEYDSKSDSAEEKDEQHTISTIMNTVKTYISKESLLSDINLIVEVVEIRDYRNMIFLKIKDDTASISAIIYKTKYNTSLKSGEKIKIECYLGLYNGILQLNITSYEKIGTGDHNIKLKKLKNKLTSLGYFDNKPVLENDYANIGIISSINAAGMKDFLYTLNQRCSNKKIYIYPSSVQGKDASNEIIHSIKIANDHNKVNIIALIRGGGAKEDLECFNSEKLAIAIHNSKIPIVTGIGHQIDTTIADMVCAKSFITPTAVAQNITREETKSKQLLEELIMSINNKILWYFNNFYEYIVYCESKLLKYSDDFVTEQEGNLKTHKNNSKITKQKIVSLLNNEFDYINHVESQLLLLISVHDIDKIIDQYKNNLNTNINKYEQSLKIYENDTKLLAKPRIFDKSKKEVALLKDMVEGQEYKIHFIDGTYNLKF